jgi:biotin operon repressor
MEEAIRLQIEKTKKRLAEVEEEIEEMKKQGLTVNESVLRGYRLGLQHELESLDSLLFAWEQQQKYSDIINEVEKWRNTAKFSAI